MSKPVSPETGALCFTYASCLFLSEPARAHGGDKMKKKRRHAELYEVLANQTSASASAQGTPASPVRNPGPAPHPPRSGREIVFGVDTAFVIFAAVLILIGSAYCLGHQQGLAEAKRETGTVQSIQRADNPGTSTRPPVSPLAKEKFTLQLLTTPSTAQNELRLLEIDQQHVAQLLAAELKQDGHKTYVFTSAGNDLYVLSAGLFEGRGDPAIKRLRDWLRELQGPPHRTGKPYAGCVTVQVKELGKRVL